MRKFALETSKDLKDLIRKLSIGLTNLAKDVDTLQSDTGGGDTSALVGMRYIWSYDTNGNSFLIMNADAEADRVNASQYLNSKVYDVGDNYNSSTGVYTVPSDGYYQFNVQLGHNLASEGDKVHLYLEKNGSTTIARYGSAQMGDSAGTICIIHGVSTHYLEEGDTLELTIFCQIDNYFSIHPYGFADVTFSSDGDIGCTGAHWEIRKIGT